jgi:hypothetical protein
MSGIAGNCKNGTKAGQVDRTKPFRVWSCANSLQLKDLVPRQDQPDQISPKVLYACSIWHFSGSLVLLVLSCSKFVGLQGFSTGPIFWRFGPVPLDHRKKEGVV